MSQQTQFADHDEATQQHIIELGCFIYDKSLEHYQAQHPPVSAVPKSNVVTAVGGRTPQWSKEYEYNQLKQLLENLSTRVFEVREEEYK